MNQLDIDHMTQRLDMALTAYIQAFEKKHKCEFDFAVANDLMGVLWMGDQLFSIGDIVYDINNQLPAGMIYDWYHAKVDHDLKMTDVPSINLYSWHKGLRYAKP